VGARVASVIRRIQSVTREIDALIVWRGRREGLQTGMAVVQMQGFRVRGRGWRRVDGDEFS
jgi:hypothetical protein